MLREYLRRISEVARRGDAREENYYSTLESLLQTRDLFRFISLGDLTPQMEWIVDGIAADCRPENRVALGFVEGLNN